MSATNYDRGEAVMMVVTTMTGIEASGAAVLRKAADLIETDDPMSQAVGEYLISQAAAGTKVALESRGIALLRLGE